MENMKCGSRPYVKNRRNEQDDEEGRKGSRSIIKQLDWKETGEATGADAKKDILVQLPGFELSIGIEVERRWSWSTGLFHYPTTRIPARKMHSLAILYNQFCKDMLNGWITCTPIILRGRIEMADSSNTNGEEGFFGIPACIPLHIRRQDAKSPWMLLDGSSLTTDAIRAHWDKMRLFMKFLNSKSNPTDVAEYKNLLRNYTNIFLIQEWAEQRGFPLVDEATWDEFNESLAGIVSEQ